MTVKRVQIPLPYGIWRALWLQARQKGVPLYQFLSELIQSAIDLDLPS